jgi:hypothetical protein
LHISQKPIFTKGGERGKEKRVKGWSYLIPFKVFSFLFPIRVYEQPLFKEGERGRGYRVKVKK